VNAFNCSDNKGVMDLSDKYIGSHGNDVKNLQIYYIYNSFYLDKQKNYTVLEESEEHSFKFFQNSTMKITDVKRTVDNYCLAHNGTHFLVITDKVTVKNILKEKQFNQLSLFTWLKISLGLGAIFIVSTYCITYYFPRMLSQAGH
jgi:hypothetical protein